MTPEGRVKKRVREVLEAAGAYYHMPVLTGHGRPSLDFIGIHRGRGFGIETKAGDGQPTRRQQSTMRDMTNAGGMVFLVNDTEGLLTLKQWLGLA